MRPIAPDDVMNLHDYELARPDFRARVIARKRARRVALGPLITLVFENRETVLFQNQEMIRIELSVVSLSELFFFSNRKPKTEN